MTVTFDPAVGSGAFDGEIFVRSNRDCKVPEETPGCMFYCLLHQSQTREQVQGLLNCSHVGGGGCFAMGELKGVLCSWGFAKHPPHRWGGERGRLFLAPGGELSINPGWAQCSAWAQCWARVSLALSSTWLSTKLTSWSRKICFFVFFSVFAWKGLAHLLSTQQTWKTNNNKKKKKNKRKKKKRKKKAWEKPHFFLLKRFLKWIIFKRSKWTLACMRNSLMKVVSSCCVVFFIHVHHTGKCEHICNNHILRTRTNDVNKKKTCCVYPCRTFCVSAYMATLNYDDCNAFQFNNVSVNFCLTRSFPQLSIQLSLFLLLSFYFLWTSDLSRFCLFTSPMRKWWKPFRSLWPTKE